jgi:hypothetical protein
MMCTFPFEKPLFEAAGLRTEFVGHPLVDDILEQRRTDVREKGLIGLFPGSRMREIERHFPVFLEVVKKLQTVHPEWRYETSASSEKLAAIMRRMAEKAGVPAERILITSLHQHTSIYVGDRIGDAEDYALITDSVYLKLLERKLCDVARMALDDRSEARLFTDERQAIEPLAFTRRYFMQDGKLRTNPSTDKYGFPVRRAEEPDNTVRLLRFVREGKKEIVLVNFSTHPDVIGGKKFSADWPGFTRRFVEKDHPEVSCICCVGCQGDSNHVDFFKPKEERFPKGVGYAHSEYMGRVIADTVTALLEKETTEHTADAIFGEVSLIYNKTNTEGEEYYGEAVQYMKDYDAGEPKPTAHINDVAMAMRTVRLHTAQIRRPVPVTLLALGDVCFVGFGGEPFTNYGTAARALAPDKTVFCSCCANGYEV